MAQVSPIPPLARTEAEPLLATIGNTPLVRLEKIPREFPGIEIFAKAVHDALTHLADRAEGDARHALTSLDVAAALAAESGRTTITLADSEAAIARAVWEIMAHPSGEAP